MCELRGTPYFRQNSTILIFAQIPLTLTTYLKVFWPLVYLEDYEKTLLFLHRWWSGTLNTRASRLQSRVTSFVLSRVSLTDKDKRGDVYTEVFLPEGFLLSTSS